MTINLRDEMLSFARALDDQAEALRQGPFGSYDQGRTDGYDFASRAIFTSKVEAFLPEYFFAQARINRSVDRYYMGRSRALRLAGEETRFLVARAGGAFEGTEEERGR